MKKTLKQFMAVVSAVSLAAVSLSGCGGGNGGAAARRRRPSLRRPGPTPRRGRAQRKAPKRGLRGPTQRESHRY